VDNYNNEKNNFLKRFCKKLFWVKKFFGVEKEIAREKVFFLAGEISDQARPTGASSNTKCPNVSAAVGHD